MQQFIALFREIDATTGTLRKVQALVDYFQSAPPEDAVWALYLLSGRKQKRLVARQTLHLAIQKISGVAPWLVEESYAVVGDLAETIALLLPNPVEERLSYPLHVWMEQQLPRLKSHPEPQLLLQEWWSGHSREHNFLLNKLMTGGFRAGVAKTLLTKALASALTKPLPFITERLTGEWPVSAAWLQQLALAEGHGEDEVDSASRGPLPFYLASPLDTAQELPAIATLAIEWKWDGIRAQLIRRGEHLALWSRGDDLLNEKFPDVLAAARQLPADCVLDGELLLEREGQILPFSELQKRIGRTKLTSKFLAAHPALFLAFDCLEDRGEDLRERSQRERRERLDAMLAVAPALFRVSPLLQAANWDEARALRAEAVSRQAEGLMLKTWSGPYKMGRRRGDWWKWKVEPMTLDAVLIYAQAGHGRRANLYTDYTFALWNKDELVPFAKAYSGLDDAAIVELDRWIRAHTRERFGPVRSVEAARVFEIAFEGIGISKRHKAGIAVRFPRILRERLDKKPADADSLERAKELIDARN